MKFTKEQQDYLKHCGEHFEILTGGRGHSKTKEMIEDMQQEIERLHSIIKEVREHIEELAEDNGDYIGAIDRRRKVELLEILDKVEENK